MTGSGTTATLLQHHADLISASSISDAVRQSRGYFSVTKKTEIAALGFSPAQQRPPALVIPIRGLDGNIALHVLRPDSPRSRPNGNGHPKPVKYEFPAGCSMVLDIPPLARPALSDPSVPLWITEGARKADSAVSHGLCCVSVLGVWNWRGKNREGGKGALEEWDSIALDKRLVYLAFDSDLADNKDVRKALSALRDFLEHKKATSRVVLIPATPGGKVGLDDYFAAGGDVPALEAASSERWGRDQSFFGLPPPGNGNGDGGGNGQPKPPPKIVIGVDIGRVVDELEDAILARSKTGGVEIYYRGGSLVRIVRDRPPLAPGAPPPTIKRDPMAPMIGLLPVDHLLELSARAAEWVAKKTKKNGDEVEIPSLPPLWSVRVLAARSTWKFRRLESVVEAPCLRPDGSVLDRPGYDEVSGILFEPPRGAALPVIPSAPTPNEAAAALGILRTVLAGFPFVDDCDRSAAFAAILTPLARPAISGPVPLFAVRAPAAGTGKSLLAHVAAIIATGRPAAVVGQELNREEEKKSILAIGIEGDRVVLIDNVEHPLGSDVLAAALTGTTFKERLLGANKRVEVPLVATWFASGNNLVVKGDLGRRVVPIDLDAKMEQPETRSGFAIKDLIAYTKNERPALIAAALTILRAFIVYGDNPPDSYEPATLESFGTFEAWSNLVRAALVWLGEPDPCAGRARIAVDSDPEFSIIGDVFKTWHEVLGDGWYSLTSVLTKIKPPGRFEATPESKSLGHLREAISPLDHKSDAYNLDAQRIGANLRKHKGRIISGLKLESHGGGCRGAEWRVVCVT